jgi:DNA-directed RNA polymerase specialized sigma24 family protein
MTKTITLQPLSNEVLAELFLSMAMKEDNRPEAERAFSIFHTRYKNYLHTIVKNVCRSWEMYGAELIEAVFTNTFLTVYAKAEGFMVIEGIPFERQEKRMKAWLGEIAKNEMLQLLRQFKVDKDKIEYTDDLTCFLNLEEETGHQDTSDYLLAEKALQSLSERDRNILTTYLMFEDGNRNLPSIEIQRLSEMWNTHPDNMRQIKKRSLAKVEMYIKTNKNK